MLPATKSHRLSLADVVPSSLSALAGRENPLGLAAADKAIVLLVDGLGSAQLAARAGHARTLAPLLTKSAVIGSRFPTTTAAALATLTTGEPSGTHGLVGYSVFDVAHDRVVNQLSGWEGDNKAGYLDPATWQRVPTLFETASVASFVIGPERYRDSGFTRAVLRGAEYRAGASVSDRFAVARQTLDEIETGLLYLYVPELDQAGHAKGWESPEWTRALEDLDGEVGRFASTLGRREGMLLTADHGMLDVPVSSHVLFDAEPGLLDGIRHVAGEPRALQLHFEPDASEQHRATVLERWRIEEGSRSWIVSRREAVDSGWFGHVAPEVEPRIGDLVIAARKAVAYYTQASHAKNSMIGQHGSWTAEETSVPLLRFGAFA
ncbi:alkaline phosphatase family protein [Lacisediminihabitans changchengi]|uniref:Alkaline phosphatase family protein n=1 Tax=Lacisediminihabitans changchengi TaxID=2787634 RepID=A0A934W3Q8_9MICO|nr:alkaline phosphatase family protein [Lacisediminihabitans changchengi]MBK4346725.1 alkaline phosphatase family protein [Lacisediminihabitans changchengi]MBK4348152.1 alkaline phosphatase family protein [Lacisediminihabitans changchengi]